tara:strand:+ start:526 stop:1116 length:591 start_codon:yes stop_codon:yes gene_type:complete
MQQKKNKFSKVRDRKFLLKVKDKKSLGDCSNGQLEKIFRLSQIKYIVSLEDQLQEDKAHNYCKEETINELQHQLRYLRNKIRKIEVFEDKRAALLNENECAWEAKLKEFVDANKQLSATNHKITKEHIEITRAYNALHNAGVFAQEQGIDIKKHRDKLPENHKWDFKATQTVLESGKVVDKLTATPKKKERNNEKK